MAKFFGAIGYAISTEVRPGVHQDKIIERFSYGDVVRNTRRLQTSDQVNDNLEISNEISILSDPFANGNFHSMRYVTFMGARWKITNVEVVYPRLKLTIGGVYNGPVPETKTS